ncbi:hypothetical protein Droror1_Dr00021641 [Drosera rotundifolia]
MVRFERRSERGEEVETTPERGKRRWLLSVAVSIAEREKIGDQERGRSWFLVDWSKLSSDLLAEIPDPPMAISIFVVKLRKCGWFGDVYHCTVRTVEGVVVHSTKKEFGGKHDASIPSSDEPTPSSNHHQFPPPSTQINQPPMNNSLFFTLKPRFNEDLDRRSTQGMQATVPIGIVEASFIRKAIIDKNARIGKRVMIINKDNVEEGSREADGYCTN